jgi:hypothetical protein
MSRSEGNMDFHRFEQIVGEMSNFRGTMLILIGLGEPTLHPRFLEALELAKKSGINRVLLQTNGMLLEEIAKDLVHIGLDELHVSMDGATKETFESIRRGADATVVANGVHAVITARKAAGFLRPSIALRYCTMSKNLMEREVFWDSWKNVLGEQDEVRFHGLQIYKAAPISDEWAGTPCIFLWKRIAIQWNGDYAFCCNHLDNRLGIAENHDRKSIARMWKDRRLERIRKLHLRGRKRMITSCAFCTSISPEVVPVNYANGFKAI